MEIFLYRELRMPSVECTRVISRYVRRAGKFIVVRFDIDSNP